VIAQLATVDQMLEKLGIEPVTIKSGKYKDIGTPFRAPTDDEKGIMQKLVGSMYDRFVGVVAAGRNMPREKVVEIADGRVYDSEEAKRLGLVDHVGYLEDAIVLAEQLGGTKHACVVMYQRPGDYKSTIYSAEAKSWETVLTDRLMKNLGARFYYLWIPGR
jgi:protease-4